MDWRGPTSSQGVAVTVVVAVLEVVVVVMGWHLTSLLVWAAPQLLNSCHFISDITPISGRLLRARSSRAGTCLPEFTGPSSRAEILSNCRNVPTPPPASLSRPRHTTPRHASLGVVCSFFGSWSSSWKPAFVFIRHSFVLSVALNSASQMSVELADTLSGTWLMLSVSQH